MKPLATTAEIKYHAANWADALSKSIATARESVYLSALSMHPPQGNAIGDWPRLWRACCDAAARNCAVDIWLPEPTATHPATLQNRTAGRAIAAAGMRVHYIKGPRLLHAKTAIIDERELWIGSGNFTAAAAHHNHEAYLQAECPTIAREVAARWKALA